MPQALHVGYHLTFYPDWLDFWRGDRAALTEKFGSEEVWRSFYGGPEGRETLLRLYREDLDRAVTWGARYVVFHVSDVSVEEGFTYHWRHTHEEVIDAAAEVINLLLGDRAWPFDFLVENQWWPGFTFTEPELTRRLLDGIRAERKGIMLDIGHLMNCAPACVPWRKGRTMYTACWTGMEAFAGTSGGFIFTAPSAGNMSGPIRVFFLRGCLWTI